MDQLLRRDRTVVWHPASQMGEYEHEPPIVVDRAEGSRLILADGRSVIDGIASWWCKSLGHRHPRVVRALAGQLERFEHHITAGATNGPLVRLAERWLEHANAPLPNWFVCAFFADNGSTGLEVALKMALHWQQLSGHPERQRFAALAGAYHGETAGALALTDHPRYAAAYAPMLIPPAVRLSGLPWRSGPSDPAWMDAQREWPAIQAQLDPVAGELAAVVVEPVLQGAAGMRLYSPDLLRRLRRWCDAHGVLLIADEIAAGAWRLGHPLASHLACSPRRSRGFLWPSNDPNGTRRPADPNVFWPPPAVIDRGRSAMLRTPPAVDDPGGMPDLAVLGKGLTAGAVPASMVLATARVAGAFYGRWDQDVAFLHSNTFAGNALAVAAAHAVLDAVEQDRLPERIAAGGERLAATLAEAAAQVRGFGPIRSCGMVAAADLLQPDGSPLPAGARTAWKVHRACLDLGALLRPLGDTLYFMPPLTIGDDDIDELGGILAAAVARVRRAGG